ncbi:MAG: Uma2 family endonuclease [Gemmataceae bacterium]
MSTVHTGKMTADQFWQWCQRPEQDDRPAELVRGVVVELPFGSEQHGVVCSWVSYLLGKNVYQRGGAVVINGSGLVIQEDPGTVRSVDIMVFSEMARDQMEASPCRRVPQLIVEVVAPTDDPPGLDDRVGDYLGRGVPLVWLVNLSTRTVRVYRPGEMPNDVDESDTLIGDGVLPDLRLPVAELFRLPSAPTPT